jgi:pyridoxamine 5'-phosphate oxidase
MTYNNTNDWPENPHQLFNLWFRDATLTEINDPNAMSLATVTSDLRPSNRMVLLKNHDERGFVFYTNSESKKGTQLSQNMNAALCFHWKSLKKQVRVEGSVAFVSDTEADDYFNSRHRSSRIGAWASKQSRPLADRQEFEAQVAHFEDKFKTIDNPPRPPHWRGYRVIPAQIEFWMEEQFRLHRRCLYTRKNNAWEKQMLFP